MNPLSLSTTPSSLSRKYDVFPSFHGADVRKTFLAHILKEFKGKGIVPFIDNDIKRSKSIGPELKDAIRGSKIAIVLLSRNYAASSWCLNELVEIIKCRKELGQIVMTIFYDVDPTEVKKQEGDFGKVFKRTCESKTQEDVKRWQKVLKSVAKIAGEHWRNWDNEASMIEKIAIDVSDMLNISSPSRDFDDLIGMEAHTEKVKSLLGLHSNEVRMIGIWGPSGIGKTTIARVLYNELSKSDGFGLSVFMDNIKELMYTRVVGSDDYSAKLHLQKHLMSEILNHKDIKIHHLGVARDRLNDKKVLIVLDSIDQSIQLDAIAKETQWFGPGSRIIITTQDQKLLKAHDINHIYRVMFPSRYEAFQIFCKYAFGKKFPKDGFEELAWEVIELLGELPLGLRVMGSHFRGMSKDEWVNALPRLKTRLDANIQSILKFSYDALCYEDKDLFLHLACLFNNDEMVKVENYLALDFLDVRHGLHLLAEKSLIALDFEGVNYKVLKMHNLLVQLGREIVRHHHVHQSILEPEKRQFVVDTKDICELLADGSPLGNLKWMNLSYSRNLKELPDLSTATKLQDLNLTRCSSLVEIPFSIGNTTNLEKLNLGMCTSLVELPSSIGRLHKLQELRLRGCSKLEVLPTNISLESLDNLDLTDCSLLKSFPEISTNIKHLSLARTAIKEVPSRIKSWSRLRYLVVSYNENLKEFPHALDTITMLSSNDTKMQEFPRWVKKFSRLDTLMLEGCKKLVTLPQLPDSLSNIGVINCDSLERLDCSFNNHPNMFIGFVNCLKLNKQARELIQTSTSTCSILPGRRVPSNFTYRANTGGSVLVNLNQSSLSTALRFKACVLLANKDDKEKEANGRPFGVYYRIMDKHKVGVVVPWRSAHGFGVPPILAEHLLTFELEVDVTSSEFFFEFEVNCYEVVIKECGVLQL
ncbi:P-loop containing nucleoside triphosphate hydrolase [Arabidopsis suecica]|uniref:ADP-ribosyl cyclase/cyclic ADP-ribose hydrolase n=1 Tax=Arabidopsis suecica TaxID=45249 RepID=A0A8T1YQH0_ARASU|nr:P-loop containing nucleoside triphosphate hydrolase [Arabidopsis suecica]